MYDELVLSQVSEARGLDRDTVETGLTFAGFVVFFSLFDCLSCLIIVYIIIHHIIVDKLALCYLYFQVFNCPIRSDSSSVLSELKGSSHDLVKHIFSIIFFAHFSFTMLKTFLLSLV